MEVASKAPVQSQHMAALELANYVRLGRTQVKRQINCGEVSVVSVLRSVPDVCQSMTVSELLCSQRRWGPVRCSKMLTPLHISEGKTLSSLTPRQRALIIKTLERREGNGA